MALINVRRDVTDPFYRYKMERLISKIEGKGNGIKTVIANLTSVAQSLERPQGYIIKYFGFELGAQTNTNPSDDRWIINGAHEANKLQEYLDGFITKFVLCKKCKNPETVVKVNEGTIKLDCKACGEVSTVDPRLKLSSFIIKNQPKKGKKDKSTKKAERKARKEAEAHDHENGSHVGSHDSHSDHVEENGDLDAGSDDEFTRRITSDAKEIAAADPAKIEWAVDISEEAVKARQKDLSEDLKHNLILNGGDEDEGSDKADSAYDHFGSWIIQTAEEKGGINDVSDVEIFLKAQELGIETKHKTLTVLAQTLFSANIVKEIEKRAAMLKKMITSERHQKAFLGGTERFVGKDMPALIPQVSAILLQYYQCDLVSEEVLKAWGTKASKKYVDVSTSRKVRKNAEKFLTWLETAEEETSDEEE